MGTESEPEDSEHVSLLVRGELWDSSRNWTVRRHQSWEFNRFMKYEFESGTFNSTGSRWLRGTTPSVPPGDRR